MSVNATHPEDEANLRAWLRARDVLAGEDAVKAGREKYLPPLDSQTEDEYAAYLARTLFFNATARTADGYVGLIFRRAPFVRLPEEQQGAGAALAAFRNDVDMLGTSLFGYAKNVVTEVVSVGRAGTLMDWEGAVEDRAYATMYAAESILNWRVERINGRNLPTLVVLNEVAELPTSNAQRTTSNLENDEFEAEETGQIRVLRLVEAPSLPVTGGVAVGRKGASPPERSAPAGRALPMQCVVELWRPRRDPKDAGEKKAWELVETRVPLRRGKPLPLIPFVFHGPRHSRPPVDKLPLEAIIAANLDHYRLDADYKHGLHYTALPTPWVSGFPKESVLRIGSRTAWVTESADARAGFLEFTGQGLTTLERAMDRDERLMAVLGSRLLEGQKRVGEAAEAIELRQSGENSVLGNIATSVSESLTQVLRWAYWWNSTEELPDSVTDEQALLELNTDFSTTTMTAQELAAVVKSWQSGALSQDTMHELFRKGEILPDGRSNEEEARLIKAESGAGGPATAV